MERPVRGVDLLRPLRLRTEKSQQTPNLLNFECFGNRLTGRVLGVTYSRTIYLIDALLFLSVEVWGQGLCFGRPVSGDPTNRVTSGPTETSPAGDLWGRPDDSRR